MTPSTTCVGVEQVVPRHAGLAGHAGGDDYQVGAIQRATQLLRARVRRHLRRRATTLARCPNVVRQRPRNGCGFSKW